MRFGFSLGRDAPKKDLRLGPYPIATASDKQFRLDKTQQGVTGFNTSSTASGGLRWGQGGLSFPDSIRLSETRWDSCRATEPFSPESVLS
jgi:hypothetical protein